MELAVDSYLNARQTVTLRRGSIHQQSTTTNCSPEIVEGSVVGFLTISPVSSLSRCAIDTKASAEDSARGVIAQSAASMR
jgi:hypothetical protein